MGGYDRRNPAHQQPYLRSPLPETPAERERAAALAEGVRTYPARLAALMAETGLNAEQARRTMLGLPPDRPRG